MFILSIGVFSSNAQPQPTEPAPVERLVPLGDPFILTWQGKYYAYGTSSPNGIVVYVSDDLKNWTVPSGVPNG